MFHATSLPYVSTLSWTPLPGTTTRFGLPSPKAGTLANRILLWTGGSLLAAAYLCSVVLPTAYLALTRT